MVQRVVYRLVAGRFRDQVEDIVQDVFLRLFRVLPRFDLDRGVRLSTWILTLVRNHCYDVLKRRRLPTVSLQGPDEDDARYEPPAAIRTPDQLLAGGEVQARIAAAVDTLPPGQRLVFVLREYQDLPYVEIAEVLGISEGTVKSRLHRAKEALRGILADLVDPVTTVAV